jgi:anaphase-promoting complex subunit 8
MEAPSADRRQKAQFIRDQLLQAIYDCRERGLFTSAKWAAQQLNGLPSQSQFAATTTTTTTIPTPLPVDTAAASPSEHDSYQLARSMFDLKEYKSAAHILQGALSPRSIFLRLYSIYLAGERSKGEEKKMVLNPGTTAGTTATKIPSSSSLSKSLKAPGGPLSSSNPTLAQLESEIRRLNKSGYDSDGFIQYLLGIVLMDLGKREQAQQALTSAVTLYPCNWSAWTVLQIACGTIQAAASLSLPDHFTRTFFIASLAVECHSQPEALGALQALSDTFPRSDTIVHMAAQAHYSLQNFDETEELFQDLLAKDPHRLEGMDMYSNVLYVKEQAAELSHLAHRCVETDRYSPATCCVIGNYYSLKGQHEKAVAYFRRALRLDPRFLSAWTLMGHEYVELKNPPAAIEAYWRAVEINPKDYRAWYGLGQTYELVDMPYYALFYFRNAVALRPSDARMWNAMGQCYQRESLGAYDAAIRCHRRALPYDREGVAVHELAKLHDRLGQKGDAAHYHRMNLTRLEAEGAAPSGQDAVEALQYLADFAKESKRYAEAEELYARLLDYGAVAGKESAKASLREVRMLRGGGEGGSVARESPAV